MKIFSKKLKKTKLSRKNYIKTTKFKTNTITLPSESIYKPTQPHTNQSQQPNTTTHHTLTLGWFRWSLIAPSPVATANLCKTVSRSAAETEQPSNRRGTQTIMCVWDFIHTYLWDLKSKDAVMMMALMIGFHTSENHY